MGVIKKMIRKPQLKTVAQLATIFLIAYALKFFYSTANVNDLRWILAPTALLVELLTGKQFNFESQAGYMSTDHTFLIAASCSGMNFFLISFLVLALGEIRRRWPHTAAWRSLLFVPFVAYLATVMANTIRIVVALASQNIDAGWLDHDELHRVQGIIIYFGFLLVLFIASEKFANRTSDLWASMTKVASGSKNLLAVYYAVTLGIPLARGSYRDPAFWEHSIVVVLIPLILILPFVIFYAFKNNRKPGAEGAGLP